ncbi:MAG: C39 family peptidase, partial [Elusimicrobia bacterium]|nr:C39 family peptidase [Elusimicrobiota bacterium]
GLAPVPAAENGLQAAAAALSAAPEKGGTEAKASLDDLFLGKAKAGEAVDGVPAPALPPDYLPVPVTVQETDYSCGAAAVLALLRYWGVYDGEEASLYPLLGTRPKDGTPPENMVRGLRHFGLDAGMVEGMTFADLLVALKSGKTVILVMQAWRDDAGGSWADTWDSGHYVALNGMDDQYAYVMDPSTEDKYAYVPLSELMERWHDYEDRDGQVRRYYQAGIVVSGDKALPRPLEPPALPERIELKRGSRPFSRH